MKIERIFWIIGAVIFSFSACFLSSVLAKDYLGMDVDFLSSGATLAAALVAVLLFNDWREQYRVDLFLKTIDTLSENLFDFNLKFYDLKASLRKANLAIEASNHKEIVIQLKGLQKAHEVLIPDFIMLKKVLSLLKIPVVHLGISTFKLVDVNP